MRSWEPADFLGLRNKAIIELMLGSGLRVAELVALNRSQLDLAGRDLVVRGKGRKTRLTFISDEAVRALEDYLAYRDDNCPAVFISESNGR